jgi:uncharacterized protein
MFAEYLFAPWPAFSPYTTEVYIMKRLIKILLRTFAVLFIFINVVSAFHAYKFTHFYNAGEITVKPDSLKSGWDKTKEALFGINFAKKKNDYAPDSSCQTITLTSNDSIKLEAWYMTVPAAKGTVAMFHGHGGNKSGMIKEAAAFRQLGYNTLLVDFRAHGGSAGNTCTIGVEEAQDVYAAYNYVKAGGEKNIILWGISLGAATITKATADYPDMKPAKIILEMPFGSLMDAVEGRVKLMGLPGQPLATLLTFWGGTEHGFWAFKNKPYEYAKKISCPVLLQWGKNDTRVKRSEIDAVYNNLAVQKSLAVYETCGHESLYKKETEKWMKELSHFLQ